MIDRRAWLAALVLGAALSACSAVRPPVCPGGNGPSRSVPAVAGRVLVRVAEVIVGTELVDHERDGDRVACTSLVENDPPASVGGPPAAASAPPVISRVSRVSEDAAGRPQASSRERPPRSAPPAMTSTPARVRPGRWILVQKTVRTLSVFDAERRVKTYSIVLGKDPVAAKLYEGDRRTPEGEYRIVSKHVHSQWQRFLLLDYPNPDNLERYARGRAEGLVPARGAQAAGTGGAIGIHGTVNDALNRQGVNWTYGCISLLSRDIQELYGIVPVGTPVIIEH